MLLKSSNTSLHLIIVVVITFPLLCSTLGTSGQVVQYSESDSFTLDIKTSLRGTSNQYSGYTENERDIRTYRVLSVNDTSVQWEMESDFKLTSNEGEYIDTHETYHFKTDPRDGRYLENTIDGSFSNRDYYTFDNIWFKIDPTLPTGSQVRILGKNFTVREPTTVRLDTLTAVDTIMVELPATEITTVYNTDYDPDGVLVVRTTREIYYYDTETGYLVKAEWHAEGLTSEGNFQWKETIVLIDSSFPLQVNTLISLIPAIYFTVFIIVVVAAVVLFFKYQKRSWKKQVDRAMGIITGAFPPPEPRQDEDPAAAPTVWNPLTLDYEVLLDGFGGDEKMSLNHGNYVITETDNRLAIVDVHVDRYMPNQVLTLRDDNLRFFYRLALGLVDIPSGETDIINKYGIILNDYAYPSKGFAVVDSYAFDTFATSPEISADPDYEQVAYLLSRRRVLDYSHGQAPLSPSSHLRKLREVLRHDPREVFLVGDDDLVSVSLARRGVNVSVVEIDPYTCALIKGIAMIEDLPVTVLQHDLRMPFPEKYGREFDLFVADPDFTIESFALFLTRGLSLLKIGGTGLINFEGKRGQLFKARYLLEALNIETIQEHKEKWRYVIIQNVKVPISSYRSGKYVHVNYTDDLILTEAAYSSVMFTIKRNSDTVILIQDKERYQGSPNSIYDF